MVQAKRKPIKRADEETDYYSSMTALYDDPANIEGTT